MTIKYFKIIHKTIYGDGNGEDIDNQSWLCDENLKRILNDYAPGGSPYNVEELSLGIISNENGEPEKSYYIPKDYIDKMVELQDSNWEFEDEPDRVDLIDDLIKFIDGELCREFVDKSSERRVAYLTLKVKLLEMKMDETAPKYSMTDTESRPKTEDPNLALIILNPQDQFDIVKLRDELNEIIGPDNSIGIAMKWLEIKEAIERSRLKNV